MLESLLYTVLSYISDVLLLSAEQLLLLFGPFLVLAVLMNAISRNAQNLGFDFFGRNIFLYGIAWLGVSIHEIGHAIFIFIFRHKIHEIVLFSPKEDGTLGYVTHSYNKKNPYQNIGNFFIGIGPIIFGSILLYILMYFFLGVNVVSRLDVDITKLGNLEDVKTSLKTLLYGTDYIWKEIHQHFIVNPWLTSLFIFLFYSIGSSMSLSQLDIEGSKKGFWAFVILVLTVNVATLWFADFSSGIVLFIRNYISVIYPILILSIILNLVFTVILFVLSFIKNVLF